MSANFKCKKFTITQSNSALKVGTDAFLIGTICKAKQPKSILDIGVGTGIISLILAQRFSNAQIQGIDIDEGSIKDATTNFSQSKWSENLSATKVSLQNFSKICKQEFDLIVSNPPFFENSVLPKDKKLISAKHTTELNAEDLFKYSVDFMHNESQMFIIIPASEKISYISQAINSGLFLTDEISIKPLPSKDANRIILGFSKMSKSVQKETICVRNENHEYSTKYVDLTKDFYINLK